MKWIFLLVFLVKSILSFPQSQLSGKFCYLFNGRDSVVCIEFLESNRFKYEVEGCLGVEYIGKGGYLLADRQLKLIFDKDYVQFQSNIRIQDLELRDQGDSNEVNFSIVEKSNLKLPLPAMIFKESDSFQYEKGKQANIEGNLTTVKSQNPDSEKYLVLFLGFERFEFSLDNDRFKKVIIELAPEAPEFITDQVFTFNLSTITQELFVTEKGEEFKKVKQ